jgi:hypothetical protein
MKKSILTLIATLYLIGCGVSSSDLSVNDVILNVDKIDSEVVIAGLPLDQHLNTESGNGRVKQTWRIIADDKQEYLKLEIIGNNQSDADLMAWNCAQFDSSGSYKDQTPESSFCHTLFVKVLDKFISNPETIAERLLNESKVSKIRAIYETGDLSFETDGQYYFIRRISRI